MARDWVILRGGDRLRWGGDLRRRYLFGSLEARPSMTVVGGFGRADIGAALAPYRRRRWEIWRRGPTIVSTEVLEPGLLDLIRRVGVALAVGTDVRLLLVEADVRSFGHVLLQAAPRGGSPAPTSRSPTGCA